jgi:hypothetical protein
MHDGGEDDAHDLDATPPSINGNPVNHIGEWVMGHVGRKNGNQAADAKNTIGVDN